jgi:hypothetical protein
VAAAIRAPARLEQEPDALLSLVDPLLALRTCTDVLLLIAQAVILPHAGDECLMVLPNLGQHVASIDIVRVVVGDALQPRDVADRVQRRAANLADALGDLVGHGDQLLVDNRGAAIFRWGACEGWDGLSCLLIGRSFQVSKLAGDNELPLD